MKIMVILLILSSVIFVQGQVQLEGNDIPKCGKNEHLDSCANPCPPTCDHPHRFFCPLFTCYFECVCNPGYVRTFWGGRCVPIEQCGKTCKSFVNNINIILTL